MATSYGTIIGHPDYAKLSQDQKRSIAQQFWKDDPLAADAIALTQTAPDDLSSIQQKAFDDRRKISALRIASREPEAAQYQEQINSGIKEQEDNLARLSSIYTPEAQNDINALVEPARNTGLFGSLPLENQLGRVGVGFSPEEYQEVYNSQRDATAQRYGLTTEQLDDVVRHQMDAQEKPVSRDALGRVHIKNNVFIQGLDSVKKGVEDSDLPASVKARELEGIDERYQGFQEAVVANTLQNHKDYAKEIGLDPQKPIDENFAKIADSLNSNRFEQLYSRAVAGVRPTASMLTGAVGAVAEAISPDFVGESGLRQTAREGDRRQKIFESQLAVSNEFNRDKFNFFGGTPFEIDADTLGGAVGSVADTVVLGRLTGGLLPTAAGAGRLVNYYNSVRKIAPTASIISARVGVQAYDQAIKSGLSKDDALRSALANSISEFGVTLAFGSRGNSLEEILTGAVKERIGKEFVKEGTKAWTQAVKTGLGSIGSEITEESVIESLQSAVDSVGSRPNMTVAEFQDDLRKTAVATLLSAGPFSAGASVSTYNQTNEQLRQRANQIAEENLPEVEAAGRDVAETGTPSLAEERRQLVEQLPNLKGDEKIGTEERIAEIDEEIGPVVDETASAPVTETVISPETSPETVTEPVETVTNEEIAPEIVTESTEETPPPTLEQPVEQLPDAATQEGVVVDETGGTEVQQTVNEPPPNPPTPSGTARRSVEDLISAKAVQVSLEDSMSSNQSNFTKFFTELKDQEDRQGHGSDIRRIASIIRNGIDENRTFFTGGLGSQNSGTGSDVKTGGIDQAVIVGKKGNQIKSLEDIDFVVVNDNVSPFLDELRKEFPNVKWFSTSQASEYLNEPTPNPPTPAGTGVEQTQTQPTEVAEQPTTPPEPASSTTEEPIGPRKSINTAIRRRFGLNDPTVRVPQTTREAVEAADAELARNPDAGRELVTSLQDTGRIANAKETALLSHEFTKSVNELERAEKRLQDTSGDDAAKRTRINDYELALANFNNLSNLISTNASEASFRLNAQKILRRKDYSYAGMLDRAYAAKNRGASSPTPLTKEEAAEVKKQSERLLTFDEELAVAEQQAYARGRQDAENERLAQAKKRLPKDKKTSAEKIADLNRKAREARQRLNDRFKRRIEGGQAFSGGITEEDVVDVAIIATSYIRAGAVALADFTTRLVKEFGETARPFADRIFAEANAMLNGIAKTPEQLVAEMDPTKPINRQSVNLMVKSYLEEDLNLSAQDVVTKLQSDLKAKWPEITREQASDAWTGYGQESTTPQTRSEVQRAASDLRRAALLQRQIDDLKAGNYNKKTRTPTQANEEIQRLTSERNELLKAAKVPVPRDPVATAKARIRKQIENLQQAVANNELIPTRTTEGDAELDALRAELKTAQDAYNEAFPEQGTQLTPNQEEDRAVKALDKQIEALEKQEFEAAKKQDFSWYSPEISEKRKRLNDLRETRNEIRWKENSTKTTQKAIDVLNDILTTGSLPEGSKRKPKYTPDQRLKALLDEKNQLQKRVAKLRKERGLEDAQYKAAEKSLRDYERRIRERDFEQKPRAQAVSERVKEIRAQRDAAQKQFSQMRRENESEAVRESRQIRALERSREDYEQRLRDGNFTREKKDPLDTEEVRAARYRRDKERADFQKHVAEIALASASTKDKLINKGKGLLEFRKLIVLGLDVMLLRQGIWSLVTRPIRTSRNLIKALSNYSEQDAYSLYVALTDPKISPNAKEYNQIKSFKLFSPLEEGFRNKEDLPDFEVLEKLSKIPGLGNIVNVIKSIERANRNLHNLIAVDTYNSLTSALRDNRGGFISKDNIALASNASMKMVGRGDSTNRLIEQGIPLANAVLLSTRYYMARFASVLGSPIWSTRGAYSADTTRLRFTIARQMYGKLLFNMAVVMGTIAYFIDDEEERRAFLDPTSPSFGKLIVNGTEYEIINSFRPFINFIARTTLGYTYKDGKEVPLRGEGSNSFRNSLKNEWLNFFWNRRNINTAFITDTINGEYYGGEPVTWKSMLSQLMNQINLKNDWEIITDDDMGLLQKLISVGAVHVGGGVESEPNKTKTTKTKSIDLR